MLKVKKNHTMGMSAKKRKLFKLLQRIDKQQCPDPKAKEDPVGSFISGEKDKIITPC